MKLKTDLEERSVSFEIPKKIYSDEGVRITAHIFAARTEVLAAESGTVHELTLRSKRKNITAEQLVELAREFGNELLNQEYRFLVGRFNQKISSLIVTQALLAARGGETPAEAPAEEKSPEFQAAVAAMLKDAEDEIRRTMPRKIAPQGAPLPPAAEEAHA